MTKLTKKVISSNKKKPFTIFIICERYTAGIVLMGTEIKSIRKGGINLKDSFAKIEDMEAFLHKCHISPFEGGNRNNHDPKRVRKLLLNKKKF